MDFAMSSEINYIQYMMLAICLLKYLINDNLYLKLAYCMFRVNDHHAVMHALKLKISTF